MTEDSKSVRDLCRQWRYIKAKAKADAIVADEDELNRLMSEAEEHHRRIEAKLAKAKPKGASDAFELLQVALDLIAEDLAVGGRDRALLQQALTAVAWVDWDEPEGKTEEPEKPAKGSAPGLDFDAMEARVQAKVKATRDQHEQRWNALYTEWLRIQATWAAHEIEKDAEGDRLGDREAEIIREMAAMRAPDPNAIVHKLEILAGYLEDVYWSDMRDRLLLTSIRTDVEAL